MRAIPKMTKGHFEHVAATLKSRREEYGANWDPNLRRALDDVCVDMSRLFSRTNGLFDSGRFLRAAGHGEPLGTAAERARMGVQE